MSGNCRKEKQNGGDERAVKQKLLRTAARVEAGGKVVAKGAPETRSRLLEKYPRNKDYREGNLYIRQYRRKHELCGRG